MAQVGRPPPMHAGHDAERGSRRHLLGRQHVVGHVHRISGSHTPGSPGPRGACGAEATARRHEASGSRPCPPTNNNPAGNGRSNPQHRRIIQGRFGRKHAAQPTRGAHLRARREPDLGDHGTRRPSISACESRLREPGPRPIRCRHEPRARCSGGRGRRRCAVPGVHAGAAQTQAKRRSTEDYEDPSL